MNAKNTTANKCFQCKWVSQGSNCVHCANPNAVKYRELKNKCGVCGRNPKEEKGGCGACIGRGLYVYPFVYDNCDCGEYEQAKK